MSALRTRLQEQARKASSGYAVPTSGARPLPDFLILGAQRCGTTSLYRYLTRHPAVMSATLRRKGAHYFDTNYPRGHAWYRSHFPTRAARRLRARKHGLDRVVTGESSPYYLFHPLVPERVASIMPDARLIVMVRDPVTRAYSHYHHEVARGFETESFERAIDAEDERLRGEEDRIRSDPGYVSFNHQHFSYVGRGLYAEQVARWREQFPAEQILVVDSARFFKQTDRTVNEIFAFLGVAPMSMPSYDTLNAHPYEPLSEDLRAALGQRFKESDLALAESMGRAPSWRR